MDYSRKIIRRLCDKAESKIPIDPDMEDWEIERQLYDWMDRKVRAFYRFKRTWWHISTWLLKKWGPPADSKAEHILFERLHREGIKFYFQYNIGPYRVDFLLKDILVFEIDGPHHLLPTQYKKDKVKDRYLLDEGYSLLRLPIRVIALDLDETINEIKRILE